MWRNCLMLVSLLAGMQTAAAADYRLIERTLDTADIDILHLNIHVGEAKIGAASDDKVYLALKVYSRKGWFGRRKAAPEDAELDIRRHGDILKLGLDDDDYREEWTVLVPAHLAVDIDLGVGEIEITGLGNDINLDVGVGDARIRAIAGNYRSASGDVGVGDVGIYSDSGRAHSRRAIVSEESMWRGDGEYAIKVDVGVGDATIDLE